MSMPAKPGTPRKAFPTAEVLSCVTRRLLCDIGGVYRVLNWMSGDDLYTHQLPRVMREAQSAMLAFRPDLAKVVEESKQINSENWRDWLAIWIARHGKTIRVIKLNADQHEKIDPISELAEMVGPDRIVLMKCEGKQ